MAHQILRAALYLRVSTADQTTDNQLLDLQRVAQQRGWKVTEIFIDHGISGSKGRDKRVALDRMCKAASQGKLDVVAAWSIDRLGRTLSHLVAFVDELRAQNVALYLHQQQVDTSTAAGLAFLQMAGVFAQFERSVIVERIHAGLARARAQGKQLGRKPVSLGVEERIRELRGMGFGKQRIGRTLGCGVSTVQRVLGAP
jgi:DNA invertase Pin-like site-specific DNA recombinase